VENISSRLDDGFFLLQSLRRDFTRRQPPHFLGPLVNFYQPNVCASPAPALAGAGGLNFRLRTMNCHRRPMAIARVPGFRQWQAAKVAATTAGVSQ